MNRNAIPLAVSLLLMLANAGAQTAQKRGDKIGDDEAQAFLIEQSGCEGENPLSVYEMKHVNLTHDGRDNLIVLASTCNTGTAGPDVHSVVSRDDAGKLIELPFEKAKMPERRVLFGNSNSDEDADGDDLVSSYHDTSDRDDPLVIRYRWNGKEFRQVSLVTAKPFPASFNCEKADAEVEQAICANQTVAKLDRDLNTVYLQKLRSMPANERDKLRQEQRLWIAKRNESCVVYKWWVDCLTEMYANRIAELKDSGTRSK